MSREVSRTTHVTPEHMDWSLSKLRNAFDYKVYIRFQIFLVRKNSNTINN